MYLNYYVWYHWAWSKLYNFELTRHSWDSCRFTPLNLSLCVWHMGWPMQYFGRHIWYLVCSLDLFYTTSGHANYQLRFSKCMSFVFINHVFFEWNSMGKLLNRDSCSLFLRWILNLCKPDIWIKHKGNLNKT